MFYLSFYFGRHLACQPHRLNILLMCIMSPLKFALHENSLNRSEPCWRLALNSLSKERKREITHRANNLIVPENIKTNEDTKKALWRLFQKHMKLSTGCFNTEQLRKLFQGHFPTTVCVCVHMCADVAQLLQVCVLNCLW